MEREPRSPEAEAQAMFSDYKVRIRAAEDRNRLHEDADVKAPARNPGSGFFARIARWWKEPA